MNHEQNELSRDDLTAIKGIGAATEQKLHEAGIQTYAQLAEATPDTIAELSIKEEWVAMARVLMPKTATPDSLPDDSSDNGQHYATFSVELLLDKENDVRRTRVSHIQNEAAKATWAGWDEQRLLQFVYQQAGIAAQENTETAVSPSPTLPEPESPLSNQKRRNGLRHRLVNDRQMKMVTAQPKPHRTAPPPSDATQQIITQQVANQYTEKRPLAITPSVTLLSQKSQLTAQLTLDTSHLLENGTPPFSYQASIFAQATNTSSKHKVGSVQGTLHTTEPQLNLTVPISPLQPGTYRLVGELNISWSPTSSSLHFITTAQSKFIHVY